MEKFNLLFLCTGNSCRSQMAEGLCRHFCANNFVAWSAGIETHGLNPNAVKVMAELGIDISQHKSKTLSTLSGVKLDYVITVCGHANETCPHFSAATEVIHRGFDDPPKLALNARCEDEVLSHYRRVRDELLVFIKTLPSILDK